MKKNIIILPLIIILLLISCNKPKRDFEVICAEKVSNTYQYNCNMLSYRIRNLIPQNLLIC